MIFLVFCPSLIGLILSVLPYLQLPGVIKSADMQLSSLKGSIHSDRSSSMRKSPFVLFDILKGIPIPNVKPEVISFTSSDQTKLTFLFYKNSVGNRSDKKPTLICLHGGAWRSGRAEDKADFSQYMTAQGYNVISLNYRLAPKHLFPAQYEDVKSALAWIKENAELLNIDPDRVAMIGWSAGAHLALLAAYQQQVIPIRAVVNFYSPVNLTKGYNEPPNPDPINSRAVLESFLGGNPAQFPEKYIQASPITYVKEGLPPSLLIYGGRDYVVPGKYGKYLHEQLLKNNNQSILVYLTWAEHAFDEIFSGMGNQVALYYIEKFLSLIF